MRKCKNEKGYALLIVLFMIIFFLSISAIFMRSSISNAMQEQRIDDSHLTVMAAEAGVDYVKQKLINEYFANKETSDEIAKIEILSTAKNKEVDYEKIYREIKTLLIKKMQKQIEGGREENLIEPYSYKLIEGSFSNGANQKEIIFNGSIEAKREEKGTKTITKIVKFKQSFLIPDYSGNSNSSGSDSTVPQNMHKLYPDNVNVPSCVSKNGEINSSPNPCKGNQNGDYKDIQSLTVYFPSGYIGPNGNINVNNSKLYSKGDFNINNFNNLSGSDLYIDGVFSTKNMNNLTDSSLNINGSVSITSNVQNMVNSSIVIRGAAHLNGHLTIENNSMVCVTGSLQVDKQLTIGQGSKLVHWGSYVAYGGTNIKGEIIQANSENEVWEKCKLGSNISVVWSKPSIEDVSYD